MKFKLLFLVACSTLALVGGSISANAAVGWTGWIDKDNPGGTSDAETLPAILQSGSYPSVCSSPSKIEAQYQVNGVWKTITPETASTAPNVFRFFNAADGLQCYHVDQGATRPQCTNYQVRFYCETDEVDLSNKYPALRQVDQQNALYNQTTPGFKGDKPVRLARVARPPGQTTASAAPPPIIVSDTFRLGQGYDSIANVFRNQCLNQNNPEFQVISTPSNIGISSTVVHAKTHRELYDALDVSADINAKGTFVVDGVDLTLGMNYHHDRIQTRYLDETHKVFVARYKNLRKHYSLVTQPRPIKNSITDTFLRGTKQINLQQDFHLECGDQFLDNVDLGASLYIVFDMDTKWLKTTEIDDAAASAEGAINKVFNINASASDKAEATRLLTKYKVVVEAYQAGGPSGLGLTGIKVDPANIPVLMKSFEDALALPDPYLVAFNETYSPYTRPEIYANAPRDAVFPDTSAQVLNAARWSALTSDFMSVCSQNEEMSKLNQYNLQAGSCASKSSVIAVLADGLKDCVSPFRWDKCVHPNQGGFDGSNYIVDRLSLTTTIFQRGSTTSPTVSKRFTKYWTCDYANITQCLPARCMEDKATSDNGKGYNVNLYKWKSSSKGSKNFEQDYYNDAGVRCVKADAHLCADQTTGAEISFSLSTFYLCPSSKSFSVF